MNGNKVMIFILSVVFITVVVLGIVYGCPACSYVMEQKAYNASETERLNAERLAAEEAEQLITEDSETEEVDPLIEDESEIIKEETDSLEEEIQEINALYSTSEISIKKQ